MAEFFQWFQHLTITGKILFVFVGMPLGFTLVGLIFIDQAGPSFWGHKPTHWTYLFRTMLVGFIATLLLGSIFGSTYLLNQKLISWGLGGFAYPVAFVISLVSVLAITLFLGAVLSLAFCAIMNLIWKDIEKDL